jgi:hypothetical protein
MIFRPCWPLSAAVSRTRTPATAAAVAVSYVQLVYGRQLQQPSDEATSADPLDVASMIREERDALKQRILAQHPHLVDELTG